MVAHPLGPADHQRYAANPISEDEKQMPAYLSRIVAVIVLASFFVVAAHYGGADAPWYAWAALCVLCFHGMIGSAWMLKSSYTSKSSASDSVAQMSDSTT